EAARLLRRCNREQRAGQPGWLADGIHEQVRDRSPLRVEEPQVGKTVFRECPAAVVLDPKWLRAFEERRIDRQPLRSAAYRRDRALAGEVQHPARHLRAQPCGRQTEDRDRDANGGHAVPLGLESTNFCNASDTSASDSASPTNDATR